MWNCALGRTVDGGAGRGVGIGLNERETRQASCGEGRAAHWVESKDFRCHERRQEPGETRTRKPGRGTKKLGCFDYLKNI